MIERRLHIIIRTAAAAFLATATVSSCVRVQPEVVEKPLPGEPTDFNVRWSIGVNQAGTEKPATKLALNGGKNQMITGASDMQFACSPGSVNVSQINGVLIDPNGMGKSIGFFSEYYHPDHGLSKDVFGIGATHLVYDPAGRRWKMVNDNNEEVQKAWVSGGRYNIRAFYPHDLYKFLPDGVDGASSKTFVIQYNTHQRQDDVMVAFNGVNTVDPGHPEGKDHQDFTDDTYHATDIYPDGLDECHPDRAEEENNHSVKGEPSIMFAKDAFGMQRDAHYNRTDDPEIFHYSQAFNLSDAVPLFFHHALAAIRCIVVMDYEARSNDFVQLKGAWMYNDHPTDGFKTTGLLVYGQTEADRRWDTKDTFTWTTFQTKKEKEPFYVWGLNSSLHVYAQDYNGNYILNSAGERFNIPGQMNIWYSRSRGKMVGALPYTNPKNYRYAVYDIDPVTGDLIPGKVEFRYSQDYGLKPLTWTNNYQGASFKDISLVSQNDGWVMAIPQEQQGHTFFHLEIATVTTTTTTTTTTTSYVSTPSSRDARFPKFTGTNKYGLDYKKLEGVISDDAKLAVAEKELCYHQPEWWSLSREEKLASFDNEDDFCWYVPGKRYTYIVKLLDDDVLMDVSVASWNYKYAYDEIDF